MKSQNAALPAAVAMPMPDGPPLTSLVTSVDSMCPDSDADAAPLRLGEQRVVGEPVVREQGLQRAGTAPEAERVDWQHGQSSGAT